MWLWQATTGALLAILLIVHMISNHFVADGGLRNYAEVVAYMSNPFVFILETIFLAVVVAHALMGVRAIILDLGISAAADRRLKRILAILGPAMFIYSTGVMWLIVRK
jgi:succinate dehydrogenase hydrophobic anchor subunit